MWKLFKWLAYKSCYKGSKFGKWHPNSMRHLAILSFFFLLTSLNAANPSFVDLVQTNLLWVAKNGNNSTANPGSPALKYSSISNAIQAAVSPALVIVDPGVYNESIILRNGIDLDMQSGVIISQSVASLAVVFDNGVVSTNTIRGHAKLIHTGDSLGANTANGLRLEASGFLDVEMIDIETLGDDALHTAGGSPYIRFKGRIAARGAGITIDNGSLNFVGEAFGTNDYGCRVSDASSSNYLSGFFYGKLNSAVHCGGGVSLIENAFCVSDDNAFGWGVEHSGGTVTVRNSILQPSKQEAIGKYGGTLMVVDGCQLVAGTNCTYSIDNDGTGNHGTLEFRGVNWVNKAINPAMNIVSALTNYAVVSSLVLRAGNGPNQSNAVVSGLIKYDGNSYTNLNAAGTLSNLASVLIPGNTLTNTSDKIYAEWGGVMPSALENTNEFTIVYGSQTILDTGLQISSNTTFQAWCKIWRTGNTGQHAEAHFEWGPGGAAPFAFTNVNLELVQTNGINTRLALQGAARRVGAHTNNSFSVFYQPAAR